MALEPFFLDIVACPETKQKLRLADAALLDKLNAAIDKGKLKDKAGDVVAPRLHAALVRKDDAIAYPVWDDMPRLLIDSGIELDQLS